MKIDATDLRLVIDTIALEVSEKRSEIDLGDEISDRALAYILQLREEHRTFFTDDEFERIASTLIKGVLHRLFQIANSGGQSGNA